MRCICMWRAQLKRSKFETPVTTSINISSEILNYTRRTFLKRISKLNCSRYKKKIFKLLYIFTRFPKPSNNYFHLPERYPRCEGTPLENITCACGLYIKRGFTMPEWYSNYIFQTRIMSDDGFIKSSISFRKYSNRANKSDFSINSTGYCVDSIIQMFDVVMINVFYRCNSKSFTYYLLKVSTILFPWNV